MTVPAIDPMIGTVLAAHDAVGAMRGPRPRDPRESPVGAGIGSGTELLTDHESAPPALEIAGLTIRLPSFTPVSGLDLRIPAVAGWPCWARPGPARA